MPHERTPHVVAILAVLAASGGVARAAGGKGAAAIVAKVNGEAITRGQLERRVRWIKMRLRGKKIGAARRAQIGRKMLQQLIDERLIAQKARKLKVAVSDADVERAIKQLLKRSGLSRAELTLRLRREGKTMAIYKRLLRRAVREGKVLQRLMGRRRSPSEAELRAAHKADPSLSRFPFARVRRVVRTQVMARRIGKARKVWLAKLRRSAKIRIVGDSPKGSKRK